MKHTIQSITGQKIAVHCKDRSEQDAFLQMCEDAGLKFGHKAPTHYKRYDANLCHYTIHEDKAITHCESDYFRKNKYTIIPFTDLLQHEYKVGDKVVPHSKSMSGSLELSTVWEEAKKINQPYLFVCKQSAFIGCLVCNVEMSNTGDHFLPSDLTPYVEPVQSEQVETSQPEPLRLKTFNLEYALNNPQDVVLEGKVVDWHYFEKVDKQSHGNIQVSNDYFIEQFKSDGTPFRGNPNDWGYKCLMLIDRTPVEVMYINIYKERLGSVYYKNIEDCKNGVSDGAIHILKRTTINGKSSFEIVHTYE